MTEEEIQELLKPLLPKIVEYGLQQGTDLVEFQVETNNGQNMTILFGFGPVMPATLHDVGLFAAAAHDRVGRLLAAHYTNKETT